MNKEDILTSDPRRSGTLAVSRFKPCEAINVTFKEEFSLLCSFIYLTLSQGKLTGSKSGRSCNNITSHSVHSTRRGPLRLNI